MVLSQLNKLVSSVQHPKNNALNVVRVLKLILDPNQEVKQKTWFTLEII